MFPSTGPAYAKQRVGINTLKRFVSLITGLSGYTNHSLRATAVSRMYNSGVPAKIISDKSGHKSFEALRLYESPEEDLCKEAEQAIVDPDKKFLNDVKVKSEGKTEAVPLPQLPAFSGLNQCTINFSFNTYKH
uniref:Tyr recombinase domain-containing protein n=1 Tax=Amphimedon queenslandica TaxID=400682 RepID=A0A1X7V6B6_AMPQE